MAENYFRENNKFLSFGGILGRRSFIVNTLIVQVIEGLIFTTPLMYLLMFNPKLLEEFGLFTAKMSILPMWVTIWIATAGLITCGLYFPSVVRRVRDMFGKVDDNRVYMISSILTVLVFMSYTPVGNLFFGRWISFFVIILLMCQQGKITSKKPKSRLIKFNWGAFLGTWIWGLFNKAPMTILMLPLFLTSSGIPFMIICGLKGNEWAAGTKRVKDVENFHKNQATQATVWAVLAPVLLFLGFFTLMFLSGVIFYKYSKMNPEFKNKVESLSEDYMEVSVESNFNKIELKDNGYNFYIEPELWNRLSLRYKKQMFNMAVNYVLTKKGSINNSQSGAGKPKSPINLEVMNKTKIYSSFNNEVLASYYFDPKEYDKILKEVKSVNEILTLVSGGYDINNYPALP